MKTTILAALILQGHKLGSLLEEMQKKQISPISRRPRRVFTNYTF